MNAHTLMKQALVTVITATALGTGLAQASDGLVQPAFKPGSTVTEARHDRGFGYDDRRFDRRQDAWLRDVDVRQDRQMDRILRGISSGRLSSRESVDLLEEQREINRLERRYRVDGELSKFEYRDLSDRLDRAAYRIDRELNDKQARRW